MLSELWLRFFSGAKESENQIIPIVIGPALFWMNNEKLYPSVPRYVDHVAAVLSIFFSLKDHLWGLVTFGLFFWGPKKSICAYDLQSELRICVLPTHLSYDAPWPVRKVPLRCTPHFISYHLESKTYTVVTSVSEPTTKVSLASLPFSC